MREETEKLYSRIIAQEQEIVNLRGGYLIIRGRLDDAIELLKARQTEDCATIKRVAIAAGTAAIEVEKAASVASELVLQAAQDERSVSVPATAAATTAAATTAAAVKLVAAELKAKVAELVNAENDRAESALAGFAALDKQHQDADTLLRSAVEIAASSVADSVGLKHNLEALEVYMTSSKK